MAATLLLSSAALAWMAWERGEVELHLFIIFPVLKASGAMGAASLLLAFLAFVAFVYALWTGVSQVGSDRARGTSVAGVIMIGPIPIVLGSDRRTAIMALVLALAVLMIVVLLLLQ